MTDSIAALPPTSFRDPDAAPRVLGHDTLEQAKFWSSDDGASFGEALDAVNPLHHIPVVSSIYRAISGDTIGLGPRLIGAAIFGGPLGFIIAGISALIEEASGASIADHALALFDDPTGNGEHAPAQAIAAAPYHAEGDASAGTLPVAPTHLAAAALAEAPTARPMISEAPVATLRSTEKPPAAAPTAMTTTVPGPRAATIQVTSLPPIDTEPKRISQTLLQAQRAQANQLLANLQAYDAVKLPASADDDRSDGEDRGPHSNLAPSGARPMWYADAMQRALDKYQADAATPTATLTGAP